MEALVYFLLWAGAIFLMMRFGCGAHVMGHGASKPDRVREERTDKLRWIPPASDVDPVCGKTIATAGARPSVHDGYVYYFCNRECREIFEAAPQTYVGHGHKHEAARMISEHKNA